MWKKLLNAIGLRYEGGSSSRKHGITSTYGINVAPNSEFGFSYADLVARCRYLADNNELAGNALTIYCDYLLGANVKFNFNNLTGKAGHKKRLQKIYEENLKNNTISFYGDYNFHGFLENALFTVLKDGDLFIRKRVDFSKPFGVSFQPVEIDHLAKEVVNISESGNRIEKGIEYNEQGQIVAYHLYQHHPNSSIWFDNRQSFRVPASEILHLKTNYKSRPGQSRGVSVLAPVVVRLGDLLRYDRAQIKKQTLSGMFAMILKKVSQASGFTPGASSTINEQANGLTREDRDAIARVMDGSVIEVTEGHEPIFPSQPRTDEYQDYHKVNGRMVSVGTHVPEPMLTNNYGDVNFSSGRMSMLPFEKRIQSLRNSIVDPLLNYIFGNIVTYSKVKYNLVISGMPSVRFPAKQFHDPVKEAEALKKMLRMNIISQQDAVEQYGSGTYEELMNEAEEHLKEKRKRGILEDSDPADDLGRDQSGIESGGGQAQGLEPEETESDDEEVEDDKETEDAEQDKEEE